MMALRILLIHNYYRTPGGEDQVFAAERQLLESRGHEVVVHTVHNDDLDESKRLELARSTLWNAKAASFLRDLIQRHRPQVAHFHNTFPRISPAAYYAAKAEEVAVVQTLHNYRLICPNAILLRDGRICEACVGKRIPWPGVAHACYRGSRASSATVAAMLSFHRTLRTWSKAVDRYIVLTEFAREKFVSGGLPADKIVVKPNFLASDPGIGTRSTNHERYALFVGRLIQEKGLDVLASAWREVGDALPLKIVGDGPMRDGLQSSLQDLPSIEFLGHQNKARIVELMQGAQFLVFPSIWYEGLPMVIVEAFATGLPVIASNMGSMSSLIDDGLTGIHFAPGDAHDLASRVKWAMTHQPEVDSMARAARLEYESKYTAEQNYDVLMKIYESVALRASRRSVASA